MPFFAGSLPLDPLDAQIAAVSLMFWLLVAAALAIVVALIAAEFWPEPKPEPSLDMMLGGYLWPSLLDAWMEPEPLLFGFLGTEGVHMVGALPKRLNQ